MNRSDICIAGAGIVGLSLALALEEQGLRVVVVDSGDPMREASWAAAGMLAANDPHNPSQLSELAKLSVALYPAFLERINRLGGTAVPFQTQRTLQARAESPPHARAIPDWLIDRLLVQRLPGAPEDMDLPRSSGFELLHEQSIDPRQLAPALIAAVAATSVKFLSRTCVLSTECKGATVVVHTSAGAIEATEFIDCSGAWANAHDDNATIGVVPIKGQMLALALPAILPLNTVVRTRDIYIVPRSGGLAIIGATVEDVGFDKAVHPTQLAELHRQAAALLPALTGAKIVDSWAGLRPATTDRLPLIGPNRDCPHHWLGTGHYRNGILLAPATAQVMTEMLLQRAPAVSVDAFDPARLTVSAAPAGKPCNEFAHTCRYSRST